MDHFTYQNGTLMAEEVALADIAEKYGSPCYVYSRATLERHWHVFDDAFKDRPHLICYAVKANSNIAVLNLFARLGSGFDIVSMGELQRVLKAKGEASKIVFSGVGKSQEDMEAALRYGIKSFNIESEQELKRLQEIGQSLDLRAPIAIRVNPDIDANTHPYISTGLKENKFGVDLDVALDLYKMARDLSHVDINGVACHIGSQLTEVTPFVDAMKRVIRFTDDLQGLGIKIEHFDVGGGLGIPYRDEEPPSPADYSRAISQVLADRDYEISLEPGRAIAGNAGVLLTKVEYIKHNPHKNFAIVDAAMNDLIRPSLYSAWMDIVAVQPREGQARDYDIVGPVCETGDFLGKERSLVLAQGDLLAVRSAGAYSFTMSSNYNSRPRVAEVLVDGTQAHLVRRRESIEDLFAHEAIIPEN